MTQINAIDGIYLAGVQQERSRIRTLLNDHLRKELHWSGLDITALFIQLDLDRDPHLQPVKRSCVVCHAPYGVKVHAYGQTLHFECLESLEKVAKLFGKESNDKFIKH